MDVKQEPEADGYFIPEIKMEEDSADSKEKVVEEDIVLLKTFGRSHGDAGHEVKQEPKGESFGNWDTQLQEFLKTLQTPLSAAEEMFQQPLSGNPAKAELQRQRFRMLSYKDARSPRDLCLQLQECCRQWLEPEIHTKEQMLELVTLEQFLAILPLNMQIWIKESGPESCAQAVTLVEEFLWRQPEGKISKLQVAKFSEKLSANSPKAMKALFSEEKLHILTEKEHGCKENENMSKGDRCLSENQERKPLVDSIEQMEQPTMYMKTEQEGDFVYQEEKETNQNQHKAEGRNRESKATGLDNCIRSQDVSEGISLLATQEDKNGVKYDKSGGKCHFIVHQNPEGLEEESYRCWHCGKCFGSSVKLLTHERTHVGEKLYICYCCGESERIHGQKPHKCSHCGTTFGCNPQERIPGVEISNMCSECGTSFSQRSDLLQHQRTHTDQAVQPGTKMAESDLSSPWPRKKQTESDSSALPGESVKEQLSGAAPPQNKQAVGEAPPSQLERCRPENTILSPYAAWRPSRLFEEPLSKQDLKVFKDSHQAAGDTVQLPQGDYRRLAHASQGLSGKRQEVYEHSECSRKLKAPIPVVEEDAASLEIKRQHFRHVCYQEMEEPRSILSELQELCHQWLLPERHTKEQIVDLVILEQFLSILPLEMQIWVCKSSPATCAQALKLAESFLLRLQGAENKEIKESGLLEESHVRSLPSKQDPSDTIESCISTEDEDDSEEEAVLLEHNRHREPPVSCPVPCRCKGGKGDGVCKHFVPLSTNRWRTPKRDKLSKGEACKERVSWGSAFADHDKADPIKRPHQCTECGKRFGQKGTLNIHKKTHTGEKPYPCSECGKRFVTNSQLLTHKRVHTGEKPYNCSYCGSNFRRQGHLVQHQRRHTGEKPYSCSYCEKSFSVKANLITHERIHTGEKPYKCSECPKSFVSSSELKKHKRVHIG